MARHRVFTGRRSFAFAGYLTIESEHGARGPWPT
jgi:hypothetical protein